MNIEEIKAIAKLMSEHDLTEFKVSAEDYNLCIRRGGNAAVPFMINHAPAAVPVPAAVPATPAPAAVPAAPESKPKVVVESPLVGTFYPAASPDAEDFVKVGDAVTADTVIGIIEAMKVMNEIKAEKSGVVKRILVEKGQPVEYGQALMELE